MSTFTDAETAFLNRGPQQGLLGRLATVGPDGAPHVIPLGVLYDPDHDALVIGGHVGTNMAGSKKFRDARRHPAVAVVLDDLATIDPWTPRGIEVRGHAETFTEGGEQVGQRLEAVIPFDPAWIRIRPRRVLAWGIDTEPFDLIARDVS